MIIDFLFIMTFYNQINLFYLKYKNQFTLQDQNELLEDLNCNKHNYLTLIFNLWNAIIKIKNYKEEDSIKNYSYQKDYLGIKNDFFSLFEEDIIKNDDYIQILEAIVFIIILDDNYYEKCGLFDLWMFIDYSKIKFPFNRWRDKLCFKFLETIKLKYFSIYQTIPFLNNKATYKLIIRDLDNFLDRGVNPFLWIDDNNNKKYFQIYLALIIYLEDYKNLLRFEKELKKSGLLKKYYLIQFFYKEIKEEKTPIFKNIFIKKLFVRLLINGMNEEFYRIDDEIIKKEKIKEDINLKGWNYLVDYECLSILYNRVLKEIIDNNYDFIRKEHLKTVGWKIDWMMEPDELEEMVVIIEKCKE